MARDPRYDVLFEPVRIGPVTAKNRFYQVPHCSGMGYSRPQTLHRAREINAEGGWAVVCTEYCSIHPSANDDPAPQVTLWDDDDVKTLSDMTERVHRHGSLAGVELWYGGYSSANKLTRENGLAPGSMPYWHGPGQSQAMDKTDIKNLRQWHRDAAIRAKRAGFDIVYVYAAHNYLPAQFLSPVQNTRTDEYGGSFENRARLIKELLEDTKAAVGDTCAVAFRFAVDNLDRDYGVTYQGEGRDLVEYVAEIPDIWDVNIANFAADAQTSRFAPEGAQEKYIAFVKTLTTKPVVGVGRFTSPDTMVGQIKRGVLDMIGAARPSIADPFLPRKIEEGRIDEIRECIGCNICVWANGHGVPLRCTQNPTRGEEWRRDWHPERIASRHVDERILVVGAGPAGLEATRALGQRGYRVALAEAGRDLGGRVTRESRLPGLGEWARVRDHRLLQINKMTNVEVYRESRLDAAQVLDFGFEHVVIATGAHWRKDGLGRTSYVAIDGWRDGVTRSVDDVLDGAAFAGPVVVYDDDHFYMGSVVAEKLRRDGLEVTLVTTTGDLAPECASTLDMGRNQARILELGITLVTAHKVAAVGKDTATIACVYTDRQRTLPCRTFIPVTSREPNDGLYRELAADADRLRQAGIRTLAKIGDCAAPNLIAQAVFAGHRYARELGANVAEAARDRVVIGA
ncbi:MAG: NADH:flavin oxidoreductase [Alphaproteobacteria bacterium]|nr:NADH:flavin oxidoreductase [Alphaproteobacteria bacterium]